MPASDVVYDLIIVGCGAAGIAAGIEFQKHQPTKQFLVVEARDRVGGRAYTDTQTFDGNTPVDLAARTVHHFYPGNPFYTYYTAAEEDKFNYVPYTHDSTAFFDSDGTPVPRDRILQAEKVVEELYAPVKSYPSDKEDTSIYNIIRDKYESIQDEQMRRLVAMCLADIESHEANSLDKVSAKSYLKWEAGLKMCDLIFPNGLGTFMGQLVEQHRLPVQLNTTVNYIDLGTNKDGLVRISDQNGRHYLTKYVLIAVPIGCLKAGAIKFTPTLPDWKQNAIDRIGVGMFNKVFIQFPMTFWDERLDQIHSASDRFRFFACYPQEHILAVYVTGDLACQIEKQSDEETVEQVLKTLRLMYPQMPKPTKWVVTRWGGDPFARGGYVNFPVGTAIETCEELGKDCYDGRVHWAGEYANYGGAIACFNGALESGSREAKLIYENLNRLSQ